MQVYNPGVARDKITKNNSNLVYKLNFISILLHEINLSTEIYKL